MGVISFRAPQEGIEQLQKAVDLISLVKEIIHNPSVGETVKDLSQKLSDAQEMSEAKKKEVFEAEEIIAQSKEFIEEFTKEKITHQNEVRTNNTEIEVARRKLQEDIQAFATEKSVLIENVRKNMEIAKDKLSQAATYNEQTTDKNNFLKRLQADFELAKSAHESNVKDFEELKNQHSKEYQAKIDQWVLGVDKLANDRVDFEARKKRFEDALKQ